MLLRSRAVRLEYLVGIVFGQHQIDYVPQKLLSAPYRIIATRQLTGLQQISAIILVRVDIWFDGICEEMRKRLIGNEFGFFVDGFAKGAQGQPTPQNLLRRCRIDRDGTARAVKKPGELTAPNVVHAAPHGIFSSQGAYLSSKGHPAIFKGMCLENQMVVRWRAFRKTFDRTIQKFGHAVDGGMRLKVAVMLKLKEGNVIGKPATSDPKSRKDAV